MSQSTSASASTGAPVAERRGFLVKFAAGAVGAVVALAPLIPGVGFLLHPLLKKKSGGGGGVDGYVPVTSLEAVPADGSPRAFPVEMDVQDAWNKYPKRQVGSVFLSRDKEGQVKCFSCVCPHLGCTINYEDKAKLFVCPCHASSFTLDGERQNQIPPRSMDPLEVKVNDKNEVLVKYETFRAGTSERKAVT